MRESEYAEVQAVSAVGGKLKVTSVKEGSRTEYIRFPICKKEQEQKIRR